MLLLAIRMWRHLERQETGTRALEQVPGPRKTEVWVDRGAPPCGFRTQVPVSCLPCCPLSLKRGF